MNGVWRVQNYFFRKSIEQCTFFGFRSRVHHRRARKEDTLVLALEKLSIFHKSALNITHSGIATPAFSMRGRSLHCTLHGLVQCSSHCSVQCSTKNIQLKVFQIPVLTQIYRTVCCVLWEVKHIIVSVASAVESTVFVCDSGCHIFISLMWYSVFFFPQCPAQTS